MLKVKSILTIVFLLSALLFFSSCATDDDNNYDSDITPSGYDFTSLCSDSSYSEEKAAYLTNTMLTILGMLDEYGSRFNSDTGEPFPDIIEHFYPSESTIADYFETLILQYRDEGQLSFEYSPDIDENGHYRFYSTDLSELINSFYITPESPYQATLDRNVFCDASEVGLLAYVESAYMRYGGQHSGSKDNYIEMANGNTKIVTIGYVLKAIGCDNVTTYISSCDGCAPLASFVIFEPTDSVSDQLGIERVISAETLLEERPTGLGDPVIYLTID